MAGTFARASYAGVLDVVPYAGDERERMLALLSRFGIKSEEE